jgi:hypothetical protein
MVSVFHMRTRQEPYHELGAHSFDERRRHDTVDRLAQRIERLGYRVHLDRWPQPPREQCSRQATPGILRAPMQLLTTLRNLAAKA